jgi:hypothetical protein
VRSSFFKNQKQKKMKEYTGFIPKQDGNRTIWLTNYEETVTRVGAEVGLTPAEITEQNDAAQAWTDSINDTGIKKTAYGDALGEKKRISKESSRIIRNAINKMKTHPSFTEGIGRDLGVLDFGQPVDLDLLKPEISLAVRQNRVKISFNKRGTQAVSVYSRIKGANNWVHVGYGVTSPFIDQRPLAQANTPEVREYMVVCVHKMQEVGLQSGIEEIVFAGQSNTNS